MANKKITRRALVMSVISLMLCCAMLVGTTFAWFTDSASTATNRIQSGNLDIEVYYACPSDVVDGDIPTDAWKSVTADAPVFNNEALWEPGYTEVVFFKFENTGSLALQYQFQVDILDEVLGKTKNGNDIQLSNYIEAYVNNTFDFNYTQFLATIRENATNPAGAPNPFHTSLYTAATMAPCRADNYTENELSLDSWQWLKPQETTYATMVLWMPTSIGNEANHNGVDLPSIDLGLNVVATQFNWENEKDSFDNNYDKDAAFPNLVNNASDLAATLKNGDNVMLAEDVTAPLSNKAIYGTPVAVIQQGGTFDGNGHSLIIENPQYDGYAIETYGGTIKNLTIDTAVGRGIVISSPEENIYIDNVIIDGPGYAINTTEHNGKNLYVTNSTVNGWTSLAGLNSVSFTNCNLGENAAKYWQNNGYDQDYDRLVRPYVTTVFANCSFENGYYIDLSALDAACTVTLNGCTVDGTTVTANNYASLITIEPPSDRTLNDCVIFQ